MLSIPTGSIYEMQGILNEEVDNYLQGFEQRVDKRSMTDMTEFKMGTRCKFLIQQ